MNFVIINNVYDNTEINLLKKRVSFLSMKNKSIFFINLIHSIVDGQYQPRIDQIM